VFLTCKIFVISLVARAVQQVKWFCYGLSLHRCIKFATHWK